MDYGDVGQNGADSLLQTTPTSSLIIWIIVIIVSVAIAAVLIWLLYNACVAPRRDGCVTAANIHSTNSFTAQQAIVTLLDSKSSKSSPLTTNDVTVHLDGTRSTVILLNNSADPCTVFLPSASQNVGLYLLVINRQEVARSFILAPIAADLINEVADAVMVDQCSTLLYSNGWVGGIGNWTRIT